MKPGLEHIGAWFSPRAVEKRRMTYAERLDFDYRVLLVKYLRLVRAHEGVDFTGGSFRDRPVDERFEPGESKEQDAELAFNDAEWAELQRLAGEARR